MAISFTYNKDLNYLTIFAKGKFTVEEGEVCMDEIFNCEDIPPDVNSLWDVRQLEFNHIDIEFLKRLVALRKKHNEKRADAKIAILSNYALAAPIVKLYTILSKNLKQQTKVFKVAEEAELWLCAEKLE